MSIIQKYIYLIPQLCINWIFLLIPIVLHLLYCGADMLNRFCYSCVMWHFMVFSELCNYVLVSEEGTLLNILSKIQSMGRPKDKSTYASDYSDFRNLLEIYRLCWNLAYVENYEWNGILMC